MNQKFAIKIYGKVQGVFFRASTREKAKELGVNGFVENLENGAVYIEAEGSKEKLEELVKWCHEGPASAEITKVEVEEREPVGFKSFQIRY